MLCNKCGGEIPDDERFCPLCGHKLQSGRVRGQAAPDDDGASPPTPEDAPRLLDFQGWARQERGGGRYVEACIYAALLVAGVVWCLTAGVLWPLYPLLAVLGLVAWLRRL